MNPIARLPMALRALHYVLLVNFLLNMAYAAYMVFVVLRPPGVSGPLMGVAHTIPMELMLKRRLYANEFWVSCAGFAIYVAITEMLPRMLAKPSDDR